MGSIVIHGFGPDSGGSGTGPTLVSTDVFVNKIMLTFDVSVFIDAPVDTPAYWSITGAPDTVNITLIEIISNVINIYFDEIGDGYACTLHVPTPGIKDQFNNAYQGPFEINFTSQSEPPYMVFAVGSEGRLIRIVYSEGVVESDALNHNNYSVDNGLEVYTIEKESSVAYLIHTSLQVPGQAYVLTASNIHDLAGNVITEH